MWVATEREMLGFGFEVVWPVTTFEDSRASKTFIKMPNAGLKRDRKLNVITKDISQTEQHNLKLFQLSRACALDDCCLVTIHYAQWWLS